MNQIMQFTNHETGSPVAIHTGAIIAVVSVEGAFENARGSLVYIPGEHFYVKESYEDIMDIDDVLKFDSDTKTWVANREPEQVVVDPAQVPYDRRAEALDALKNIVARDNNVDR